eukprot:UN28395
MLKSDEYYSNTFVSRNPSDIKARTDTVLTFQREYQDKNVDHLILSLTEQKTNAQLEWFLNTNFGSPYAEYFYGGGCLLGADTFVGNRYVREEVCLII